MPPKLKATFAKEHKQAATLEHTIAQLHEEQQQHAVQQKLLKDELDALGRQQVDAANNVDFITRLKDLAEQDARAALLDSHSAMQAMNKAQHETQRMQHELQQLRDGAAAAQEERRREEERQQTAEEQARDEARVRRGERERGKTLARELVQQICDLSDSLRRVAGDAALLEREGGGGRGSG